MAKAQLDWLKTEKGDEGQGEHPGSFFQLSPFVASRWKR